MSTPISTEALKKNLETFLLKLETEKNERKKSDKILQGIDRKLKNARLIPNYLFILLGIAGILAFPGALFFD